MKLFSSTTALYLLLKPKNVAGWGWGEETKTWEAPMPPKGCVFQPEAHIKAVDGAEACIRMDQFICKDYIADSKWKFGLAGGDGVTLFTPYGHPVYQDFQGATHICIGETGAPYHDWQPKEGSPYLYIKNANKKDQVLAKLMCDGVGAEGVDAQLKMVHNDDYSEPMTVVKFKKGNEPADDNLLWGIQVSTEESSHKKVGNIVVNDACTWLVYEEDLYGFVNDFPIGGAVLSKIDMSTGKEDALNEFVPTFVDDFAYDAKHDVFWAARDDTMIELRAKEDYFGHVIDFTETMQDSKLAQMKCPNNYFLDNNEKIFQFYVEGMDYVSFPYHHYYKDYLYVAFQCDFNVNGVSKNEYALAVYDPKSNEMEVLVGFTGILPSEANANGGSISKQIKALTFDNEKGVLYGLVDKTCIPSTSCSFTSGDFLYIFDLKTGAATEVAPIKLEDGNPVTIGTSISFCDHTLYIGTFVDAAGLWKIDTVDPNTGVVTQVGDENNPGEGLSAIACLRRNA